MKFDIKHIAAAAAFVAMGAAHAAPVTVNTGDVFDGLKFSGSASLTLSADVLGALDTGKIALTPSAPAIPSIEKDTDGFYVSATIQAPITSVSFESTNHQVLKVGTQGGLTMTAPVVKSVSSGGSLTVTNLTADLTNNTIYATLIGANGVGTLTNFALWNFASITGGTVINGKGTYDNTLTGLSITTDGFNKFSQSLGLLKLGVSALKGIDNYGTINSSISAVPEASTTAYSLAGMALVGLMLSKRRKAA